MSDQTIVCKVCESEFVFTEGEQTFYQEKQFATPKKCPVCRKAAKEARKQGGK